MPNHVKNIVKIQGEQELIDALVQKLSSVEEEEDFNGKLTGKTYSVEFDFNKIIPKPESVDITSGTITDMAIALIRAEAGDMTDVEKMTDYYPWIITKVSETDGYKNLSEKVQKELRVQVVMEYLNDKVTPEMREEGKKAIQNIKKYGVKDWYGWCNKFWGTKWNAYDIGISRPSEDTVEYQFSTAWSCPAPVLVELSKQNPSLTIEVQFADEDFGYNCGKFKLKAGTAIKVNAPKGGSREAYEIAAEVQGCKEDYFYDMLNCSAYEDVMDGDGGLVEWAEFYMDGIYGIEFGDFDEPKVWILNELEKMAVDKDDFEYAQHIKVFREKLDKKETE